MNNASGKTTIFIAGDSTATNQSLKPFAGWGQMMQTFFNAVVDNHAFSGRSTISFIAEKRLDAILEKISPGDFLLVQFGHNDQKDDERHTEPFTTYTEALKVYIASAREKGATPVLITPVHRRRWKDGEQCDTLGDYPEAVRRLAAAEDVPLIDLHKKSGELLAALGEEKSKDIFLHIPPGVYEYYPNGLEDDTHFSEPGAVEIAKLVVGEIRDSIPKLAELLV